MAQNSTEKQLAPAQHRAIIALCTNGSISAAALDADVGRTTIYRWMRDPAFAAALRDARREVKAEFSRGMVGLGGDVLAVLRRGLQPDQPMGIQLRTVQVVTPILNFVCDEERLEIEQASFEERLAALEALLAKEV